MHDETSATEKLAAEYQKNRAQAVEGATKLAVGAICWAIAIGILLKVLLGAGTSLEAAARLLADAGSHAVDTWSLLLALVLIGAIATGRIVGRLLGAKLFIGRPFNRVLHALCLAGVFAGLAMGVPVQLSAIGIISSVIISQFTAQPTRTLKEIQDQG